jgi:glycosyltransferase involved in cell wall biosynthesis
MGWFSFGVFSGDFCVGGGGLVISRNWVGFWNGEAQLIHGKRLVVVMPAYNAETTVEKTLREIPAGFVDQIILVDDFSRDQTAVVAEKLGLAVIRHPKNRGYGGNQKTCYRQALLAGADVVVMLHPDYQYSPRLVVPMASMIASGQYDVVLASRVLSNSPIKGGMPIYKYVMNRLLTLFQNLLLRAKISEYHTGYRAFSRKVLESLPLEENSDDFVFDNEMLAQAQFFGFSMGELSCPARYEPESSSISLKRSIKYGFGVLGTTFRYRLQKWGLAKYSIFDKSGRRLDGAEAPALVSADGATGR